MLAGLDFPGQDRSTLVARQHSDETLADDGHGILLGSASSAAAVDNDPATCLGTHNK
jgi:hypothetical protein